MKLGVGSVPLVCVVGVFIGLPGPDDRGRGRRRTCFFFKQRSDLRARVHQQPCCIVDSEFVSSDPVLLPCGVNLTRRYNLRKELTLEQNNNDNNKQSLCQSSNHIA